MKTRPWRRLAMLVCVFVGHTYKATGVINVAHILGKQYSAAGYICTRCLYREDFVDFEHEITLDEAAWVEREVRRMQGAVAAQE